MCPVKDYGDSDKAPDTEADFAAIFPVNPLQTVPLTISFTCLQEVQVS